MTHSFPTRRSSDLVMTQINGHQELTVGQVAARSGVAVTALHFYESKGLIKSSRNQGNQRRYPREVLRRVALIKVAQGLGIPLAEIGSALKTLPDDRAPTASDWKIKSEEHTSELQSLMRISYAVFCLKKKKHKITHKAQI